MDAVEFIKAWERMCNSYNGCYECPLKDETCSLAFGGINANKIVPIVKQWAKEHSIKTRQSVFLEQYPNARVASDGMLSLCPSDILGECSYCVEGECDYTECRRKFWMQEVE